MINLVKLWILISAACVSGGWLLSMIHQVNLAGYASYFLLFALGVAAIRRVAGVTLFCPCATGHFWKWRHFRRPLPLVFLLTAILAALGGVFHAPNNYDALTYRVPRALNWWANSGWFWIPNVTDRMNLSGAVFEWIMTPILVFTHSDRLFFLINIVSYLLLPSLVFSAYLAAGAPRRTAWFWMWLLPSALCYAMQAGGISNDTIAATYLLAAVYFGLSSRRTGRVGDLWMGILAAALTTGVKASNLPLLLPLAWVFWPCLGLLRKNLAASLGVFLLAMLISFLPTANFNLRYTGDWGGDPGNSEKVQVKKPLVGILGNSLQLGLQSLEPPFLPLARTAENWIWDRFPAKLQNVLKRDFPRFLVGFRELPQEESAGVGIGITVICIVAIFTIARFQRTAKAVSPPPPRPVGWAIGLMSWVALLAYMAKLGSESTSRLISAYYPLLLLPLIIGPAQSYLVRRRWYPNLALCVSVIALLAVILTPSRPLWPAGRLLDWGTTRFPRNRVLAYGRTVYEVYRCRNDLFAPLRKSIPDSVRVIGLIQGGDDPEASFWHPFGARRVVHVTAAERSQHPELQWFIVKNTVIGGAQTDGFDRWVRQEKGTLVARQSLIEKAGTGPEAWSVIRFSTGSSN